MSAYVDPQFITINIYIADAFLKQRNTEVHCHGTSTDELQSFNNFDFTMII